MWVTYQIPVISRFNLRKEYWEFLFFPWKNKITWKRNFRVGDVAWWMRGMGKKRKRKKRNSLGGLVDLQHFVGKEWSAKKNCSNVACLLHVVPKERERELIYPKHQMSCFKYPLSARNHLKVCAVHVHIGEAFHIRCILAQQLALQWGC